MDDKNKQETEEKIKKLAEEIVHLSRNTLVVNLRFLDAAINQLKLKEYSDKLATDGEYITYNPRKVIKRYRDEKERVTRDYLHMIMHCIFHHMFVNPNVNIEIWDLASDIAVESAINELGLKCTETALSRTQDDFLQKLKGDVKFLTAEKIYAYYVSQELTEKQIANIRGLFYADDHYLWYSDEERNKLREDEKQKKKQQQQNQQNSPQASKDQNLPNKEDYQDYDSLEDESEEDNGLSIELPFKEDNDTLDDESLEGIWNEISDRVQTDLETFAKGIGDRAGSLMQNLKAVNREKYDYTSFLKKFAVMGEAMKINDDEFDYVFYTYGLSLYDNMPLVEPLEYKDVKRIKEFVIAIDTSGSVYGGTVQKFLTKTYNILKSTESFFSKINVHIIQCDAVIQEDVKITCQEEFDEYIKNLKIYGGGGTDFRPVFDYVDELNRNKEFTNLKGLIYFTDGYGNFPNKKPNYETAFIFIDEEYNNYDVPPWAIKLILSKDDI